MGKHGLVLVPSTPCVPWGREKRVKCRDCAAPVVERFTIDGRCLGCAVVVIGELGRLSGRGADMGTLDRILEG